MKGRSLLRGFGVVVLVFGAVWIAMLWRWRAANRVPNGADITLWLVALPVALLLGLALVFWGVRKVRKRRAEQAAQPAAGADPTAADAATPDDPSLAWQVPLLAADALFAAGDSPATLAEAARAGQRAELHPALRDAQGLPVFAAEVPDVDLAAVDETLPEAAHSWHDARKRALALAQSLATRLLDEHFGALREASAPVEPTRTRKPHPVLHLEWLLPAAWSDAERQAARDWLVQQLAAQGWSAPELELEVQPVASGSAALKRLDDLLRAFHANPPPLPHLLLASDSQVDDATITEWDAARRLQRSGRPEGQVPGEGASALLLIAPPPAVTAAADARPPTDAGTPTLPAPIAHLHRLFAAQRARAVDQPGRLDSATLQQLASQALQHAKLEPEALAYVVGDTGMRASRSAEAMHFLGQALPDADPSATLLTLGTANGDCGAALALGTVAVAARLAADTQQPGLIFSNHDAVLRCAAVLTSPAAHADNDATATDDARAPATT